MRRLVASGLFLLGLCGGCRHADTFVVLLATGGTLEVNTPETTVTLREPFQGVTVQPGTTPRMATVGATELLEAYGPEALPQDWDETYALYFTEETMLTATSQALLTQITAVHRHAQVRAMTLIGFTDGLGTREENQELAQCRANTILRALRAAGVRAPITATGAVNVREEPAQYDAARRRVDVSIRLQ